MQPKEFTQQSLSNPFPYDYNKGGIRYAGHRRTDPHIAAYIHTALGSARTVLNVGAGAGSYEPSDRYVLAVEPSIAQRAQRPSHLPPAMIGTAESLPFDNGAFDASMAMFTLHHWGDMEDGLREMKRLTRQRVLVMSADPDALDLFWNVEYFREVVEIERKRYPRIEWITDILGPNCRVESLPIPLDCVDGFQEAFYGRPEAFLDKEVRKAQSAWRFLPDGAEEILVQRLADDLASGEWDRKFGHYRTQATFMGALRLIIAEM